jgi:hypothetical protein
VNKAQEIERQEAIADLREWCQPGTTVYCQLKHVARSGMMRVIDLHVIRDGDIYRISWNAAKATTSTYNRKHEGVTMTGCGMDMGFALVHDMAYNLYPDGYDCPGKPACNSPEHYRKGEENNTRHAEGGYALKHRWL